MTMSRQGNQLTEAQQLQKHHSAYKITSENRETASALSSSQNTIQVVLSEETVRTKFLGVVSLTVPQAFFHNVTSIRSCPNSGILWKSSVGYWGTRNQMLPGLAIEKPMIPLISNRYQRRLQDVEELLLILLVVSTGI